VGPDEKYVHISKSSRARGKFLTTVRGMHTFGLNLKAVAKIMSKKFACSCSAVRGTAESVDEIVLQGDCETEVGPFIVQDFNIDKSLIYLIDSKTDKKSKM